jgi:NAD(P)-dependent dehydrogenase (short-subunit alcohol dehydrogenase family)
MTRQMAMNLAADRIRVNALAPGLVHRRRDPTPDSLRCDLIPLRRAGTPAEMAAVVAFLLSEQSSYVTGQVIHADGGTSVQLVPPGLRL